MAFVLVLSLLSSSFGYAKSRSETESLGPVASHYFVDEEILL